MVIRDGRAVGVEWERRGRKGAAAARSDIVLSAGAFNTPHLLQLSGIGPAEHLRSVGIEPLVDSPEVGSNLQEHAMTLVNWELREGHIGLSDATHPKYLVRWLAGGRGKLASNIAEALALIRTDDSLEAPDFELLFGPAFFWEHGAGEHPKPAMVIAQSLWTPKSRGTVLARSADPKELPAVQLNMLTERADVDALIRAIRRSREIGATEPMAGLIEAEIQPGSDVQTDEELEAMDPPHLRAHLPPLLHRADRPRGRRRRRPGAPGPRRREPARSGRLGPARDHAGEHERARDHGRGALRELHPGLARAHPFRLSREHLPLAHGGGGHARAGRGGRP